MYLSYSGEQIRKSLNSVAAKLPGVIKDIRGWGLMNGVEMTAESGVTAAEVAKLLMESGVLVVPAGNYFHHHHHHHDHIHIHLHVYKSLLTQIYVSPSSCSYVGPQVVRFVPPLVITEEEVADAMEKFEAAVSSIAKR